MLFRSCRGVALDVAALYRFRPALLVNALGVAVSSIWIVWFPDVLKLYRFACYAHVKVFLFTLRKSLVATAEGSFLFSVVHRLFNAVFQAGLAHQDFGKLGLESGDAD